MMASTEFTTERRGQIIRLLAALTEGLPQSTRRVASTSGFVNEIRSRTCPDCLANGRVMFGCETCGGAGVVAPARIEKIAGPDALPDDGKVKDPYAVSDTVVPYGLGSSADLRASRDAEIDRMGEQLRDPWKSPEDELAAANRTPHPWERERAMLRRRFDVDRLLYALEVLRDQQPGWCALVHSIYVYAEPWELSAAVEEKLERALMFINDRMPDPIRAPGDPEHPAAARQRRRNAA